MRRRVRSRTTDTVKAALALLALGLIVLGVVLLRPPAVSLAGYRIAADVAYDTARLRRGYRISSVHFVTPDGATYHLPSRHWPRGLDDSELVRRLNADRVATLWLRGGENPGSGYPTVKGFRNSSLSLDPAEALRVDRRDHRRLLWIGSAFLLLGLALLFRARLSLPLPDL